MSRKFKPLNENQLEVLTLLKRHAWCSLGGSWFCRTRTATRRILESLERQGLAKTLSRQVVGPGATS